MTGLGLARPNAQQGKMAAYGQSEAAAKRVDPAHASAPSLGAIFHYTFFNQAPNARPVQSLGQSDTGVVTGDLNQTGSALTYSLAQAPAKGSVTIGTDGSYVYTPTTDFAHIGGTDTFRVTLDSGQAYRLTGVAGALQSLLHSLAQAVGLSGPDATTVVVTASITAVNKPPTITGYTTTDPGPNGVVTGVVTATDPNGDALAYAVSTPGKGSVTVTANGEFTYTPTIDARRNAYLPGAPATALSDQFTVTVSDGYGGSIPVPVTVSISPALTYVTGDVKRDPTTGRIALRTVFPESTQQPGTGTPGWLTWLIATPNVGPIIGQTSDVDSWDNLYLVGTTLDSQSYDSSVSLPTNSVLRNPQNGAVAIRTIFDETDPTFTNMAWDVATTSQGALIVSSASLQGWDVLFVPSN
ncbi:Ig-like domain-containing protein [Mycolicibacterium sp. CH28]|uniref:Ig-like domain-containing protein n=1 Tax=Mycolicibacterium sp. CH28 TaxID=2512237 RepID=UPI001386F886|nr:Ig-like domain-containing protein [Mycolicibacterium sp. CH28]